MPIVNQIVENPSDEPRKLRVVRDAQQWDGEIAPRRKVVVSCEGDGRFESSESDERIVVTAREFDAVPVVRYSDGSEWAGKESKRALTAEEQMALYEEALKNDDWGHQPC